MTAATKFLLKEPVSVSDTSASDTSEKQALASATLQFTKTVLTSF